MNHTFLPFTLLVLLSGTTLHSQEPVRHPPPPRLPLEEMDNNKDGYVSKEEWIGFHEMLFAELDRDGDNRLSKQEGCPRECR